VTVYQGKNSHLTHAIRRCPYGVFLHNAVKRNAGERFSRA